MTRSESLDGQDQQLAYRCQLQSLPLTATLGSAQSEMDAADATDGWKVLERLALVGSCPIHCLIHDLEDLATPWALAKLTQLEQAPGSYSHILCWSQGAALVASPKLAYWSSTKLQEAGVALEA